MDEAELRKQQAEDDEQLQGSGAGIPLRWIY